MSADPSLNSPPAAAQAGSERRQHPRTPVKRPVRLQVAGEQVQAVTANVSAGGLFVKCATPPPVGTRVRFVLDLAERAIRGHAEVAWIRVRWEGTEAPRGMGLRIVFLLDDGAAHFAEFVAAVEAGRVS